MHKVKARLYKNAQSFQDFEDIEIDEALLKNYRSKKGVLQATVLLVQAEDGIVIGLMEGKPNDRTKWRTFIAPLQLFKNVAKPGVLPSIQVRSLLDMLVLKAYASRKDYTLKPSPLGPGHIRIDKID